MSDREVSASFADSALAFLRKMDKAQQEKHNDSIREAFAAAEKGRELNSLISEKMRTETQEFEDYITAEVFAELYGPDGTRDPALFATALVHLTLLIVRQQAAMAISIVPELSMMSHLLEPGSVEFFEFHAGAVDAVFAQVEAMIAEANQIVQEGHRHDEQ